MAQGETALRIEYGRRHHTVYGEGETEWQTLPFVARLGGLPVDKFRGYRITEIGPERMVIACGEELHILRPGETLVLVREVDGREWSDGCVYDGDTYILKIIWL